MIKAAVLGSPISHSLSPFIHNRAYEILGVDGRYESFEVDEQSFETFLQKVRDDAWTGFSLTMPLKEVAIDQGFDVDSRALKIQSANTLINVDGSYKALSTDVLAFDRILSGLTFSRVAVIGGGGTARAALGALDSLVDEVSILQRSERRNSQLLSCMSATKLNFLDFNHPLTGYDLVISTTPVGASDKFAVDLPEDVGNLIEVLYNPSPTQLSAAWKEKGGTVIDGLDLLVEQALDQIHLMTGENFDFTSMRATLLADVRSYKAQQ